MTRPPQAVMHATVVAALIWVALSGAASSASATSRPDVLTGRIFVTQLALYDCPDTLCGAGGYWKVWAGRPAQRPAKLDWLGTRETWTEPMQPAISADGRTVISFEFRRGLWLTRLDHRFRQIGVTKPIPVGLPLDPMLSYMPSAGGAPWSAALSPSGDSLALVGPVGGVTTLFTQNLDGSGVQTLVRGPPLPPYQGDRGVPLAWSVRDTIAFGGITGGEALWAVPAGGGTLTELTAPKADRSDAAPVWSADGACLVFSRAPSNGRRQVRILRRPLASRTASLIGYGLVGALSPDGRSAVTISQGPDAVFAGVSAHAEVITNLTTGHRRSRVLSPGLAPFGFVMAVAWLP